MWIHKNFIYLITFSFISGIFLRFKTDFDLRHVSVLSAGLFLLILLIIRKLESRILIFFVLVFVVLGFVRMEEKNYQSVLVNHYKKEIVVWGEIIGEPKQSARSNRYQLKINKIQFSNQSASIYFIKSKKENIIFSVNPETNFQTGNSVKVKGKVQKPENFITDSGFEFDYINYLRKDQIYGLMYYSQAELLDNSKSTVSNKLFSFKNYLKKVVSKTIPPPQSDLLNGLLLGEKQDLDSNIEENFRVSGLIHVIVFSGFHVALIILIIFKITVFLPRHVRYLLSISAAILIAVMMGGGATVVRASTMAVIVIIGKFLGRNYQINRSLCLTGLIMLFNNPLILFYDLSFQLSFAATIGIVNLSKKIYKLLKFIPENFGIRGILSATAAAQLSVTPIILKMSGELPVFGLPANLIVIPLIPLIMIMGIVAILLSVIYWPLGLVFSFPLYVLLGIVLFVVDFFATLPFSSFYVGQFNPVQTFLFYSLIIIFLYIGPARVYEAIVKMWLYLFFRISSCLK